MEWLIWKRFEILFISFILFNSCGNGGVEAWKATIVSSGSRFSCAITTEGGVKCWGANDENQLGTGTKYELDLCGMENDRVCIPRPVDVVGLEERIVDIDAGGTHVCVLTASGGVKCWGSDSNGRLGGEVEDINKPVDVTGLSSGVVAISAGGHSCALMSTGDAKCWGPGPLGDGTWEDSSVPVDVTGVSGEVTAVSAGGLHSCVITTDSGLKCWGHDVTGRSDEVNDHDSAVLVDFPTLSSGVKAVSNHALGCAITTSDNVKCWSYWYDSEYPEDVSGFSGELNAITTGLNHACALTSGGAVKCWGDNMNGQLGDGTTNTYSDNSYKNPPVNVVGLSSGVISISAGLYHTCAVTSEGSVVCWGYYWDGQLGRKSTPDDRVGIGPVTIPGTETE